MSIQKHFYFSLGLTSMSDASSFRDAVLARLCWPNTNSVSSSSFFDTAQAGLLPYGSFAL